MGVLCLVTSKSQNNALQHHSGTFQHETLILRATHTPSSSMSGMESRSIMQRLELGALPLAEDFDTCLLAKPWTVLTVCVLCAFGLVGRENKNVALPSGVVGKRGLLPQRSSQKLHQAPCPVVKRSFQSPHICVLVAGTFQAFPVIFAPVVKRRVARFGAVTLLRLRICWQKPRSSLAQQVGQASKLRTCHVIEFFPKNPVRQFWLKALPTSAVRQQRHLCYAAGTGPF